MSRARDRRQKHEDFIKERRKVDRRTSERHVLAIPMELTAGGDLYFHVSGDLSEGGAFFDRAIPHPVGTEVEVVFMLPGPDAVPIRCRGQVVNVPERGDGLGMGVQFLDLSDSDRDRIQSFTGEILASADE
ncbi:MAG: PilZ domain-containing protein [Deltaproteobacteria bacterium]|nr:PilZ domain-containing protein [Deltaproteobacteria bacterium]